MADTLTPELIAESHRIADFEHLRTGQLRRAQLVEGLLSDGLHALRTGRYDVAAEFMERARDLTDRTISTLQSASPTN